MSRLADRITRVTRPGAAPMGFGRTAEPRPAPTLLCLLRLNAEQAGKVRDAAATGADAVIISGLDAGKLGQAVKKSGDLPVGVRLESAEQVAVAGAREAGVDFVLLDEQASAQAVLEEGVGLVLNVSSDINNTDLRVLAGLPLEALEIAAAGDASTLRGMLELRRLSMFSQRPLLVEVPPDIDASGLQVLREAGAVGVILDGKHVDKLGSLQEAVLSLPPRGQRWEGRAQAVVSSPAVMPVEEEEEEEPE